MAKDLDILVKIYSEGSERAEVQYLTTKFLTSETSDIQLEDILDAIEEELLQHWSNNPAVNRKLAKELARVLLEHLGKDLGVRLIHVFIRILDYDVQIHHLLIYNSC